MRRTTRETNYSPAHFVGRSLCIFAGVPAIYIFGNLFPVLGLLLLLAALLAGLSIVIEACSESFVCDCDECAHVLPSQRERWHRNGGGSYLMTSREAR